MTFYHSDPADEKDPDKQPDIEVFQAGEPLRWFWRHAASDRSLPFGEPNGPFASEADALADARVPNIWRNEEDTP